MTEEQSEPTAQPEVETTSEDPATDDTVDAPVKKPKSGDGEKKKSGEGKKAKSGEGKKKNKSGKSGGGKKKAAAPPEPAPRSPWLWVTGAASVVLLAATIVFAVLFAHQRSVSDDRAADLRASGASSAASRSALTTAQKAAVDFSTYDYRTLAQSFATVERELTGSFKKDYKSTAASLKPTLTQYQAIATAKILQAGVTTISAKKAVVIVFLDQTVTSKTSKTPTVGRNRIQVTLLHSGHRWLVSALDLK